MYFYLLVQINIIFFVHFIVLISNINAATLQNLQNVEDAIEVVNLSKKSNESRIVARHLYLPPGEPDFILPEVIDNRVRSSFRPLLTSITSTKSVLPPSVELRTPFVNEYRYLPPLALNTAKTSAKFEADGLENLAFIKINSMSCRNEDEVFFRASVALPKLLDFPVIEGAGSDACKVIKVNDEYRLDFSNDLFWSCGVQDCSTETGKFYCMNIRFPSVSGLRLNGDVKVLLRCRVQEKTTSHVKRINVKPIDTYE